MLPVKAASTTVEQRKLKRKGKAAARETDASGAKPETHNPVAEIKNAVAIGEFWYAMWVAANERVDNDSVNDNDGMFEGPLPELTDSEPEPDIEVDGELQRGKIERDADLDPLLEEDVSDGLFQDEPWTLICDENRAHCNTRLCKSPEGSAWTVLKAPRSAETQSYTSVENNEAYPQYTYPSASFGGEFYTSGTLPASGKTLLGLSCANGITIDYALVTASNTTNLQGQTIIVDDASPEVLWEGNWITHDNFTVPMLWGVPSPEAYEVGVTPDDLEEAFHFWNLLLAGFKLYPLVGDIPINGRLIPKLEHADDLMIMSNTGQGFQAKLNGTSAHMGNIGCEIQTLKCLWGAMGIKPKIPQEFFLDGKPLQEASKFQYVGIWHDLNAKDM
ncbi:hypothetical protein C8R47DRAFT_1228111 [Mycena vitilis]|nr:hypothetical protein C8R47DRAFT_1228111 [Mycena vitilis]